MLRPSSTGKRWPARPLGAVGPPAPRRVSGFRNEVPRVKRRRVLRRWLLSRAGRNRFRDGDRGFCGYFPLTAQDLARRRRQRRRKLAADEGLREDVAERFRDDWSPQQSGWTPTTSSRDHTS